MLTQTSHDVLCDILKDFYRYLAVEDNHTMSEIYRLSKTEGEEQYLDMSSVFLEFEEYSPISAGDIFFIIHKKFPYFDDWQTKVLHEASKRFMNEFDRSCGTTADELLGNIDYYSKNTFFKEEYQYSTFYETDDLLELDRF
ncbi:hypothetical protein [Capnocytophaga canimorsus]|uniref:hypothetical protein n=1 Tax=Capnocytophaga canimorsus TaxID=28188 RepID=UPI001EDCEE81|nr:hypothetical protein [Capnocytophaga canimorsus]GJQ04866.1 hypothetical protein CAPN009_12810 [Capnocytophaga canimorsus]